MDILTTNSFKKERRASSALYLFLILFFYYGVAPALAAITLTAEQIQVYGSASETQRVHFLISRAKAGQHELAATLLQHFPLQGPHAADRTLYVEGLILEGQGDLTGAVEKYRAALADDPSLTLVRAQLAETLAALGKDDSAKHHLKLLEAEAPNEYAARGIRSFIDRIDAKRPLTFSGFISLAPTTNLNGGSSHSKVYSSNPIFGDGAYLDISAANQKQSGVGLAAGASIGYSKRLGNHVEAVLAADVSGQIYADHDFNSTSFSQSAELRYHLNNGYIGFGAIADEVIDPNAVDIIQDGMTYHSFGPRASLLRFISPHDTLTASAVYEWRDYANSSFMDGTSILSEVSLNHGFNSTFNVTVSGGYDKVDSETSFLSYNTFFGGLGFYKELPLGITLNGNTQARFSKFDDMNPVFFKTREDQRYSASLTLTKRDFNIAGFAPSLSYAYTKNFSNIATSDYDAHAVDFRLTKDF